MNQEITDYIAKRYPRWLEFSSFHCEHAGIADQSIDVLNEVILALLCKDETKLLGLYNRRKNVKKVEYRELDFFVLRMIKLNIFSPTSPYQSKYRSIPKADVKLSRLKITEDVEEEFDKPAIILERINMVRIAKDELCLSEKASEIFEFKFFQGNSFSEWIGPESHKELYDTYNKTEKMIKDRLNGNTLL